MFTKNRNISFEYPPKSYFNQATPQISEIENFKPQKILRSSLSPETRLGHPRKQGVLLAM